MSIVLTVSQTADGTYDVRKPSPWPFIIDIDTGNCIQGRGTPELTGDKVPWRLLGFQEGNENSITLTFHQWKSAARVDDALGLQPVFSDGVSIFTIAQRIRRVQSLPDKEEP